MFTSIHLNHKVPNFKLPSYFQGQISESELASLAGKWVVLFFYPSDFDDRCKNEIVGFQDNLKSYTEANTSIVGCSTDSSRIHEAWVKTLGGLDFLLASDPHHIASIDYNVFEESSAQSLNGTFIIDPNQNLRWYEIADFNYQRSQSEILRILTDLQNSI